MDHTDSLLFDVLLQLVVMIAAARIGNRLLTQLGQPGVIGEIIAGLLLGPSLFGHFLPDTSLALFGANSSAPITILSQIGLVLLMFQLGVDFDFEHLRRRRSRNGSLAIAAASGATPWVLGFGMGRLSARALAPDVDPLIYSLFCGIGLTITAVPVLGRILREFDLTRTEIGIVAMSTAVINDVTGWVLLAAISAYASGTFSAAAVGLKVTGIVLLGAVAWFALRPLVNRITAKVPFERDGLPANLLAMVVCLIFVLGMCTYELGIFTIFGGFLAGLLFHENRKFAAAWRAQVGRFVLVFFLPVFFTYTGLRTNILGLTSASDWVWFCVVLVAAILGKLVPVYIASRACGFAHNQCAILGALMNTRGLTELIVLNVGHDLKFIPHKVFTMFVIMAVVTTMTTGPVVRALLSRTGHLIPRGVEA